MQSSVITEMLIRIAADSSQLRSEVNSLRSNLQSTVGGIESLFGRLKMVMGGLTVGYLAKQFVEIADSMALTDARLQLVTNTAENFKTAQAAIYDISQQYSIGLQEMSTLFTKLHGPVERMGGSVKETTGVVAAFSAALKVGGASTQEAAAATLQFSQAMASGRLQGDELRSLAEASPRFMQAMAEGMGKPVEALKKMGSEGKLTADIVGNALLKELTKLQAEARKMPDTVGGAFTRVKNDILRAIAEINQQNGITAALVGADSKLSHRAD